ARHADAPHGNNGDETPHEYGHTAKPFHGSPFRLRSRPPSPPPRTPVAASIRSLPIRPLAPAHHVRRASAKVRGSSYGRLLTLNGRWRTYALADLQGGRALKRPAEAPGQPHVLAVAVEQPLPRQVAEDDDAVRPRARRGRVETDPPPARMPGIRPRRRLQA